MWPDNHTFLVSIGNGGVDFGVRRGGQWLLEATQRVEISNDLAALDAALSDLVSFWKALPSTGSTKKPLFPPRLRVALGSGWFDGGMLPWNPVAISGETSQAFAHGFLEASGVDLRPGDAICLNEGDYQKPRWAAAYSGEVLQSLQRFAVELGAVLDSVQPLATVVAGHYSVLVSSSAVLALYEKEAISYWHCRRGEASLLGALAFDAHSIEVADQESRQLWSRLQLRNHALLEAAQLHYLEMSSAHPHSALTKDGMVLSPLPQPATQNLPQALLLLAQSNKKAAVDPIAASHLPSVRHATALLLVIAVMASLLFGLGRVEKLKEGVDQRLALARTHQTPPPTEVLSKQDQQRIRAANVAIGQMNLPVAKLLKALQPPQDIRVAVLSVEFSPETEKGAGSSLKLNAESRSGEEMVRYAAYVAERKPIIETNLLSHEIVENDAVQPYRFKMEALWRD